MSKILPRESCPRTIKQVALPADRTLRPVLPIPTTWKFKAMTTGWRGQYRADAQRHSPLFLVDRIRDGGGKGISSRWDCVPNPPPLHPWGGRPLQPPQRLLSESNPGAMPGPGGHALHGARRGITMMVDFVTVSDEYVPSKASKLPRVGFEGAFADPADGKFSLV